MTDAYRLHGELPALDRPVLVVHLHGWIDASGAAAAAAAAVDRSCATVPLATFDGDSFVDYRARRPLMELRDGVNTRLVWSDIVLRHGTDANGNPVLTLTGPEPDSQWRRFAASVSELALRLGVYQMVAFGAYPFASPHTRQPRLSATSPSLDVVAGLPFQRSSLDVPAGMSAVLEHALTEAGIASLGLWVQVPHYVSAMAFPAASVALLEAVRDTTGLTVDATELVAEAASQRRRIDQLVAANDDHAAMVRQLEAAYDSVVDEPLFDTGPLPTGEDLAAEFERFLREQPE